MRSIIKRATAAARISLLCAFAGAMAILGAVIVERVVYQSLESAAVERLVAAQHARRSILLADERLTMSAHMAAATGERRWIERYDANIPVIEAAIAAAMKLAPPAVAERFDRETRVANDRLVAIERQAFEHMLAGRLGRARALLDGADYARHKKVLSEGTERFATATVAAARRGIEQLMMWTQFIIGAIALTTLLTGIALWRGLSNHLRRSEQAFLQAQNEIRDLSANDALTGVANRRAFRGLLGAAVEKAEAKVAVVMIDIDRFKPVNDRYGHLAGDLVLKEATIRIQQMLHAGQVLARYGGDEFAVLVPFSGGDETVERLGRRIAYWLSLPMTFDDLTVQVSASVGIAASPAHGRSEDELLHKAEVALYRAKEGGRGQCCVYDATMDGATDERMQLQSELESAIAGGEIEAYFQPFVELRTNTITGFEVLCRWRHPKRGLLSPDAFIDLAQEAGVMNDLTMSVLRSACIGARDLPAGLVLALNVAPQQIQDEWLVQKILAVLTETGMAPGRLEVELTESALVGDLAAAKHVITSLKNVGISVSLDDFGTGYSSLGYLSELPFDKIKIDRSFIMSLHSRDESAKIVNAIIGLGRSLGVPTVAEGVESEEDAEFLKDIGCTTAQGFLYAPAMDAATLKHFLATTTLSVAPVAPHLPRMRRPRPAVPALPAPSAGERLA